MKKKFLSLLVVGVVMISSVMVFTGCQEKAKEYDLRIAVVNREYGVKWASELIRKFEKENNVKVKFDPEVNLQSNIPNYMKNKSDHDLFFCNGIAWEKYAAEGKVCCLDDLYESEVENGVKLKNRIEPSLVDSTIFNNKHYKVPWVNGVGGIIYNKKMFEDNGWSVPAVFSNPDNPTCKKNGEPVGLKELCEVIVAAGKTPFVWSQETYYWDYLVFDWWAQIEGIDFINQYKNAESPEVFNPETHPGKVKALKYWKELIGDHPEYSMEDSVGKVYTAAQMEFYNGRAAMLPCGQWISSGEELCDPNVCQMALMPAPLVSEAKKDEHGNPIRVSYTIGGGEEIIIPKNAPNPDLAKKFILFIAREDNMKIFSDITNGVMLAMDYSNIEVPDNAKSLYKSIFEVNKNSKKFNLESKSTIVLSGELDVEWPLDGVQHYGPIVTDPSINLDDMFASQYETIKQRWTSWDEQ